MKSQHCVAVLISPTTPQKSSRIVPAFFALEVIAWFCFLQIENEHRTELHLTILIVLCYASLFYVATVFLHD